MEEMDGIDRNFQPCYIDGCPEEGVESIQVRPGHWREFCPKHAAEWREQQPRPAQKATRTRQKAVAVPDLQPGMQVVRVADAARGWPVGTVGTVLQPDRAAGRNWKRPKARVHWKRQANGLLRLGGGGAYTSLIDVASLQVLPSGPRVTFTAYTWPGTHTNGEPDPETELGTGDRAQMMRLARDHAHRTGECTRVAKHTWATVDGIEEVVEGETIETFP